MIFRKRLEGNDLEQAFSTPGGYRGGFDLRSFWCLKTVSGKCCAARASGDAVMVTSTSIEVEQEPSASAMTSPAPVMVTSTSIEVEQKYRQKAEHGQNRVMVTSTSIEVEHIVRSLAIPRLSR